MKLFPGVDSSGADIDTDPILLVLDNSQCTLTALLNIVGNYEDEIVSVLKNPNNLGQSISENVRAYVANCAINDLRKNGERVQADALIEALQEMRQYYNNDFYEMENYWVAVSNHYRIKWREENE